MATSVLRAGRGRVGRKDQSPEHLPRAKVYATWGSSRPAEPQTDTSSVPPLWNSLVGLWRCQVPSATRTLVGTANTTNVKFARLEHGAQMSVFKTSKPSTGKVLVGEE